MESEESQRVRNAVESAVRHLVEHDRRLLTIDVNERTITQRLAVYLEQSFPEWNVDCEYNRILGSIKEVVIRGQVLKVVPDIIVHRRYTADNLIAIEAKKIGDEAADRFDREKLNAMREQLGYKFLLFMTVTTGGSPEVNLEWL